MAEGYAPCILDICIKSEQFKSFNIKVRFSELGIYTKGIYHPYNQTIELNKNDFIHGRENSGRDLWYVFPHELTHAFQDYMLKNEKSLVRQYGNELGDYLKTMRIARDSDNVDIEYFGIKGEFGNTGSLHIEDYTTDTTTQGIIIDNLSKMFYSLNITEAEAFHIGECRGNAFVDSINNILGSNIYDKNINYNIKIL